MRVLVLMAVLMLPAMAGIAQSQCPPRNCPPRNCQPVQHYPAVYQLPTVSHCQLIQSVLPIQSSAHCGRSSISICNSVYAQPTYSVVAPTCGVTCPQSHIVYGHGATVIRPGSIPGSLPSGDCNCGAVVQVYPQSSTAIPGQGGAADPRKPFSLSGQVHADTGKAVPNVCEIEFMSCCAYGANNCMASYFACSEATGEPMRHRLCPQATPTIDE